jgi:hypothetical protein
MQIEYQSNRLTSTGSANGLEDFCLFRIAGKFGAQISEAELSVRVHVKRPSSAPSAASPDVTNVTSLGFHRNVLPSRALSRSPHHTARHQRSFNPLWAFHSPLFKHFFNRTGVPLHTILPTTRSLAAVSLNLSGMVK